MDRLNGVIDTRGRNHGLGLRKRVGVLTGCVMVRCKALCVVIAFSYSAGNETVSATHTRSCPSQKRDGDSEIS